MCVGAGCVCVYEPGVGVYELGVHDYTCICMHEREREHAIFSV